MNLIYISIIVTAIIRFIEAQSSEQLILTPYIENGKIEQAQDMAKVQHPKFASVESYSGYLTVNKTTDSQMFFWFFPSQERTSAPLLLWLQGGPGYSSLYGLFLEIGPFVLDNPDTPSMREHSWHKNYNLLFLDNPVGVGFSTSKNGYVTNQQDVGRDLYAVLVQFLQLFPDMAKVDFYIVGESFGGKYIAALGHTIHINNRKRHKVNLKGVIGISGLYDLSKQFNYADYLYQLGFIDDDQKDFMAAKQDTMLQCIKDQEYSEAFQLYSDLILDAHEVTPSGTYYNNMTGMYNFLDYLDAETNLTMDRNFEIFLNQKDIKEALHVGNTNYSIHENAARRKILVDVPKSITPWIVELVSNYKFLSISGTLDVIMPYALLDNYWLQLNHSIAELYKNNAKQLFHIDDELMGFSKTAGNLTQVVVRNAGHSVPRDKPMCTYHIIRKFINGQELD